MPVPKFLEEIAIFLRENPIDLKISGGDGRVDSSSHELVIIDKLQAKFGDKRIFKMKDRHWFDIKVECGDFSIPVNIKTTEGNRPDNVGNITICAWAYTDEKMDLETPYQNPWSAKHLGKKILSGQYNKDPNRDYWFLVINKRRPSDVIINSMLGLSKIVFNRANLPFQVKWGDNKRYIFKPTLDIIITFIRLLKKPTSKTWQETLFDDMEEASKMDLYKKKSDE